MTYRHVLPALVLLAACSATTPSIADPAGSQWSFVAIDGKRPVSAKATLTIEQGRIGANLGCNGMGGDLKIEQGRLITGPIMSTQMYCDGLMEQERAVAELLQAKPRFFIEGERMVIHAGEHKVELVRKRD